MGFRPSKVRKCRKIRQNNSLKAYFVNFYLFFSLKIKAISKKSAIFALAIRFFTFV